ncbi:unnamed protein product [Paramecium octaurelia]|uniref:Transmembrane protein n=1 Tax=Paramecium octaurelia TaxID=43137 RepID=A0A8S1VPI0_PAROT|nr:unnamed protein product [Paramecium octaurelia]
MSMIKFSQISTIVRRLYQIARDITRIKDTWITSALRLLRFINALFLRLLLTQQNSKLHSKNQFQYIENYNRLPIKTFQLCKIKFCALLLPVMHYDQWKCYPVKMAIWIVMLEQLILQLAIHSVLGVLQVFTTQKRQARSEQQKEQFLKEDELIFQNKQSKIQLKAKSKDQIQAGINKQFKNLMMILYYINGNSSISHFHHVLSRRAYFRTCIFNFSTDILELLYTYQKLNQIRFKSRKNFRHFSSYNQSQQNYMEIKDILPDQQFNIGEYKRSIPKCHAKVIITASCIFAKIQIQQNKRISIISLTLQLQ